MSRCASRRAGTTTRSTWPSASSRILRSGEVEFERRAIGPGVPRQPVGRPQGLQDRAQQRPGHRVRVPVDRRLRLGVVQAGGGTHHHAVKAVPELPAVAAEHEANGQRRPFLRRAERAEVGRHALGQHGNHAVGEVDRIAALQRLPIHRRARLDEAGDVRDRDRHDEAAGVVGCRVRLGVDRVVVVLGVGRVDGDERQVAPVLASRERRGRDRRGLGQRVGAERVGDAVGQNRQHADRTLARLRPDPLRDPHGLRTIGPRPAERLDRHEVAVARLAARLLGDDEVGRGVLLVDGRDAPAPVGGTAEHAKHARARLVEELDHARRDASAVVRPLARHPDPREHAVADAGGGPGLAPDARDAQDQRRRGPLSGLVPIRWCAEEVPVAVAARHVGHDHRGQDAREVPRLAPPLEHALVLEVAQQALQRHAVVARDAERAGDLALADRTLALPFGRRLALARDEGQDLGLARESGSRPRGRLVVRLRSRHRLRMFRSGEAWATTAASRH